MSSTNGSKELYYGGFAIVFEVGGGVGGFHLLDKINSSATLNRLNGDISHLKDENSNIQTLQNDGVISAGNSHFNTIISNNDAEIHALEESKPPQLPSYEAVPLIGGMALAGAVIGVGLAYGLKKLRTFKHSEMVRHNNTELENVAQATN